MKIKEITNCLQDEIYNDENLSLPFVVEKNGKEKLAYFVFDCSDSDDILEITNISRVIIVDYDTTEICYIETVPEFDYPIKIAFDALVALDDLDMLYERYYNSIEQYLIHSNSNDYCNISNKLLPVSFKNLYKQLGAKFL